MIFDILAYTDRGRRDVWPPGAQTAHDRGRWAAGALDRDLNRQREDQKTGMLVELPLLPQLEATLDAGPAGDLAFMSPGAARRGPESKSAQSLPVRR